MKKLVKNLVGLCLGLGTVAATAVTACTVYDFGNIITGKAMKKFDKSSKEGEDSTTKEEN